MSELSYCMYVLNTLSFSPKLQADWTFNVYNDVRIVVLMGILSFWMWPSNVNSGLCVWKDALSQWRIFHKKRTKKHPDFVKLDWFWMPSALWFLSPVHVYSPFILFAFPVFHSPCCKVWLSVVREDVVGQTCLPRLPYTLNEEAVKERRKSCVTFFPLTWSVLHWETSDTPSTLAVVGAQKIFSVTCLSYKVNFTCYQVKKVTRGHSN